MRSELAPDNSGRVAVQTAPMHESLNGETLPADRRAVVLLLALLALGVGVRLVDITQPFIDTWSWRQSGVAMVAENFYRHGFDLFHPRINYAGDTPGYVGTEFPLVPLIASFFYLAFGVQEWIGRSISVAFFAASVPFFYLLVRKVFGGRSALFAVGVYALAPLSIYSSRSFMPDTPMLSLSIMSLYCFSEWLERPNDKRLTVVTRIVTCLAILIKIPALVIGVPLLYMAWEKHGARLFRRPELWSFAAWTLVPVLVWYSHAWFVSVANYPYHFLGEGGFKRAGLDLYMKVLGRVAVSHMTPVVFAGMIAGALLPSRRPYGRVFHWWLLTLVVFVLVVSRGNRHAWYQLPFVPVAAAFTGRALDVAMRKLQERTRSRFIPALVPATFFIAMAVLSYKYVSPHYSSWGAPMRAAGLEIDRITPPDALLLVQDKGDPALIYYSKRRGWHFPVSERSGLWTKNPRTSQEIITHLEKQRAAGADYLVFTSITRWWLDHYKEFQQHVDARYRRVSDTDQYVIFALNAEPPSGTPSIPRGSPARAPSGRR